MDRPNVHLSTNDINNHFVNIFIREWKSQLQSSTGKLRLYKKIKNIFYENYLELHLYLRNPLTKLRISNHSLRVETGRFNLPPLPIDQRKCFFCENFIEDELHFLFDCNCYYNLEEHKDMISYFQFLNPNFDSLPNDEKWIFVSTLNDSHADYVLCSFVSKGFILRNNLINK